VALDGWGSSSGLHPSISEIDMANRKLRGEMPGAPAGGGKGKKKMKKKMKKEAMK